jgi:hypothetical protein
MDVIYFLLFLGAALCFAIDVLRGLLRSNTVPLVSLGLLLWVCVYVIQSARALD